VRKTLALLLAALSSCAAPRDRLVSTLPEGVDPWWFTVSRDGSTAAYAERRNALVTLTVGDRRYGPYT